MSAEIFQPQPSLPPPREVSGPIGWVRKNLFSSPLNMVLTVGIVVLVTWASIGLAEWAIVNATFTGSVRAACQTVNESGSTVDASGACWTFIRVNLTRFMFGLTYARESAELWRPITFFALFIGFLLLIGIPKARTAYVRVATPFGLLALMVALPIVSFAILDGAWLGLAHVPVAKWGGLLLTLVLATVGIVFAFPLGLLFALGRRSSLPIVRVVSVVYIEVWRGAPLITFLFISLTILPLFLGDLDVPRVMRAMIIITLFQSSYTAEAIRGGLAAIPRGQYEAADSLGLGWWSANLRIILPQALTISIPSIVSSFIELVKDTTLVAIIALSDIFGVAREVSNSSSWAGYYLEGFIFVAVIFFVLNFTLSRYSKRLESSHKQV